MINKSKHLFTVYVLKLYYEGLTYRFFYMVSHKNADFIETNCLLASIIFLFYKMWQQRTARACMLCTLCCFVVYSTRRFILCLVLCYFVVVFFFTTLGEERANFGSLRSFVRFALV